MSARLTFFGAAGQVTGSMHLLEAAGARILLDAGLFQGRRTQTNELNRKLPVDPRIVDAIIVSHAHIDHTGRLPYLVAEGFHGPIYATPCSRTASSKGRARLDVWQRTCCGPAGRRVIAVSG